MLNLLVITPHVKCASACLACMPAFEECLAAVLATCVCFDVMLLVMFLGCQNEPNQSGDYNLVCQCVTHSSSGITQVLNLLL